MIAAATENERRVRQGYAAFVAGDTATLQELFHPGIIWHAQRLGQLGGDHVGWPAVADFFRRSMELTRGTFRADLLEVMSNDNGAAAVVRSSGERDPAAAHALQAPGGFGRVQPRLSHGCAQRHQQPSGAEEEDLLRFHC